MRLDPAPLALVSLALVAAVPITVGSAPAGPAAAQEPFPTPEAPLVINEGGVQEMSLAELIAEFERVAGQHFVADAQTRDQLRNTSVGLFGGVHVPAEEAYSFVESLLARHRFVLGRMRSESPRLLSIRSLDGRGGSSISEYIEVDAAHIERYAGHPALLVETVLDLAPMDARQVSNSMRGLLRDMNYQSVIAFSTSSIVLRGTGSEVARMTSMLAKAREHYAAEVERQREEDARLQEQGVQQPPRPR